MKKQLEPEKKREIETVITELITGIDHGKQAEKTKGKDLLILDGLTWAGTWHLRMSKIDLFMDAPASSHGCMCIYECTYIYICVYEYMHGWSHL